MHDIIDDPRRRMLSALLRIPFQAINMQIVEGLRAAGHTTINSTHLSVFQHLPPSGARAKDLAERAQITKQSMSELLGHLEDHGYIERMPDPNDGRARIVRLTRRGYEVHMLVRALIADLERGWRERLGSECIDQLLGSLRAVVNMLEAEHEQAK